MALSWNEIKERATQFSNEWADTSREEADAKPFLTEFFNVFGVSTKRVSTFEYRVKKLGDKDGYIDLLWKGTILIEMKSRGRSLEKAFDQAIAYTYGLKEYELPKYILVSDFENFRLYNLENEDIIEFKLNELLKNVEHFGFLAGYQKRSFKEQDPVNIKAAELMGKLHDKLREVGYEGHALELYLVRLLFILFADDTTIFDKNIFVDFIEQKTAEDGSDLAARLNEIFYILNTPNEKRLRNIDEHLNRFPYINGKLFEEPLPIASFDTKMRATLLECCYLDWGKISPAIFGSMFQSVMNPVERRNLGAHYTSEKNILKVIKPLFLDELWSEFEKIKGNKNKLTQFHIKLSELKFLDPACGCGNFLVITYRELRFLELEVLRALNKTGQRFLDIRDILRLDVDMMYGIEYEEFPARIAEVAMWLIDHQMNMMISQEFGQYFTRLPLRKSANIVHGNALEIDWSDLLVNETIEIEADAASLVLSEPAEEFRTLHIKTKKLTIIDERKSSTERIVVKSKFDYILGNPPFIGKKEQSQNQKRDIERSFRGIKGIGVLDYVSCWYLKAAQLIQNTQTKVAFVSTNSITQGEQVGVLWNILFNHYHLKIHFAHRTFQWKNEAKGVAAVHCVIIGFANFDIDKKRLFVYDDIAAEPHELKANNINPYLVDAKDIFVTKRSKPLYDDIPEMRYGSMPIDSGNLILSDKERIEFIEQEPELASVIRPYTGGDEFINNKIRWCLWLVDADPTLIRNSKLVSERVARNRAYRLSSSRAATVLLADTPTLFGEIRQPDTSYIIIPKVSSENRKYIPIGMLSPDIIASGSALIIPTDSLYTFAVLNSMMHMAWVAYVGGRLESRFQYSASIIYNNFPWPEAPTEKQKEDIEQAAQAILTIREQFPNNSLSDLYSPISMPPSLVKAHSELDKKVDIAYANRLFKNNIDRMEYLLSLYKSTLSQVAF